MRLSNCHFSIEDFSSNTTFLTLSKKLCFYAIVRSAITGLSHTSAPTFLLKFTSNFAMHSANLYILYIIYRIFITHVFQNKQSLQDWYHTYLNMFFPVPVSETFISSHFLIYSVWLFSRFIFKDHQSIFPFLNNLSFALNDLQNIQLYTWLFR